MWRCGVSYSLKEYGFKAQNVIFTELTCSLKFQAESKKKVWSPQTVFKRVVLARVTS